jgi:tight adherence protein C
MAGARARLAAEILRAGWRESPERVAALTVISSGGLAALGLSTVAVFAPVTAAALAITGAAVGVAAVAHALRSAVISRRRRLTRELAPLLELFVLELGGGGSAMSALGSVTMQLDGELAAELRRLLIASHVSGSATFEARLREYSERLRIPALASLATTLTASREFGTAVTQGVRALAADLRRSQRRELIAHSRRALNHVLFPAAIGVLLPFLAILLFPAITALQRNLR